MSETATGAGVRDVVGIGFGPSGLALAVALTEHAGAPDAEFLESRHSFSWHDGMLLEGARMQISCLKDLASPRAPGSPFTFLRYLHEVGRLDAFINLDTLRPSRIEFDEYFRWAAERVGARVRYGTEVVAVEPVVAGDEVTALRVRTREVASGAVDECLTYDLVLSAGAEPRLPAGVKAANSRRVFHSSRFRQRMADAFPDRGVQAEFLVVGDGQSAAEIVDHLSASYPAADVTAATRGIGYRPMDETPFVNEIFMPVWTETFHGLRSGRRDALMTSLRDVNYGVVDRSLVERLYRTMYESTLRDARRVGLLPFHDLTAVDERPDGVHVEFADLLHERTEHRRADLVVLATGYSVANPHPVLAGLARHLATDDTGRYRVDHDYRVGADPTFRPGVYLQGYAETTHGLGETLLSVAAVRAGEVAESLRRAAATRRAARCRGVAHDKEVGRVPARR